MILHLEQIVAPGRYSHVFTCHGPKTVCKLFRKKPLDPDGIAVNAIFQSEVAAYRHLRHCPDLMKHAPAFFGECPVRDVLDSAGHSVAGSYHLNCCYEIERLDGEDRKISDLPEEAWSQLEPLFDQFSECDLDAGDASVFGWEEPTTAKLVDFSLGDAAAQYQHLLFDSHGHLVE